MVSELVSIVVPCFNEQAVLPLLYERLRQLTPPAGIELEFILVDDGSTDNSWEQISSFARCHPNWTALQLSRNFGHQKALWTGLEAAKGDAVFVIDADLQDPPELLEQFVAQWKSGNEVVYGVRNKRKESWIKRAAYISFYRILKKVADIDIPLDSGDFCLMDRTVLDRMLQLNECSPFIRGARAWVGFRQMPLEYERDARAAGVEKYGIRQLVDLALNGLFSYSKKPVRALFWLSAIVTFSSIGWLACLLGGILFPAFSVVSPGIISVGLGVVGLLAACNLFGLGVLGEYIYRIFETVKERPVAVVSGLEVGSDVAKPLEENGTPTEVASIRVLTDEREQVGQLPADSGKRSPKRAA